MITNVVPDRWPNQEEAFQFAMEHPACMLDKHYCEIANERIRKALAEKVVSK